MMTDFGIPNDSEWFEKLMDIAKYEARTWDYREAERRAEQAAAWARSVYEKMHYTDGYYYLAWKKLEQRAKRLAKTYKKVNDAADAFDRDNADDA